MKIVHICLSGPMTDGWNYQENLLTKYHTQFGHDVSVITSRWVYDDKGNLVCSERDNYDYGGVRMIRLVGRQWGLSQLKTHKNVYQRLQEEAPDILFVHGCQFLDIYTIARYCKKHPQVTVYVDNHADFSNSATNWVSKNILHKLLWRRCAKKIQPYTTKFYGVLPARVEFLKEMYHLPADKCELLVMGADDELVEAAAKPEVRSRIRERYGIAEDDFLVMTGGKIDAFKTQTLLLMEAVKNIDDPRVKLIVFGSVTPELKDKVEALADGSKVQYIGWVQAKDSYEYFAAADLVVFPGRHSVFWEQVAAQGIPMLVKYWNGTTHVDLGGNVELLKQDTAEEIQTVIERLLADLQQYAEMKRIAVEEGMKTFSYRDIAKRSIAI